MCVSQQILREEGCVAISLDYKVAIGLWYFKKRNERPNVQQMLASSKVGSGKKANDYAIYACTPWRLNASHDPGEVLRWVESSRVVLKAFLSIKSLGLAHLVIDATLSQ